MGDAGHDSSTGPPATAGRSSLETRPPVWQRALAALALVLAPAVAWLNWPDPATAVLALLCGALALVCGWPRTTRPALAAPPPPPQAAVGATGPAPRPATPGLEAAAADWPPPGTGRMLSAAAGSDAAAERHGRARLRILVAEDHEVNRQYLAEVLRRLGHDAVFVADGEQAVAAVTQPPGQPYDVVLMDLAMPRLDGIAATTAIRGLADSRRAAVPIVALTADEGAQTRGRCLLAGMNDFLTKPIHADALAACLRRLFGDEVPKGASNASGAAGPETTFVDHRTLNQVLASLPRERVAELCQEFFADAPGRVARLRASVRDARLQALHIDAHALRGAALHLGLVAVAQTASALDDGASHLAAHEVALLLQRLEEQLLHSREALRAMGLPG